MASVLGQAPGEVLIKAFEHYMGNPHLDRVVRMSANADNRGQVIQYGKSIQESKTAAATDVTQLYRVQQALRPMYGKRGVREPDIGDHPDFEHLKGTDDTTHCAITTLFMDIEGSTRLGILYPLDDVWRIKNAFIRTAIEVITSFDGHVHRIMGDAVMAYFGGPQTDPHGSAIDGLNCAAVLRLLAERMVAPKLGQLGFDHEFGIRIGLDFGPKDSVLWSSYGYPKSDEVTATSFFVDVASKLQHAAGRNQIMIGDSIKSFLDLPDDLVSVKTASQSGKEVPEPFVTPNHTTHAGRPVDYRQYIFQADGYLKVGAFGQNDTKLLALPAAADVNQSLRIDAELCGEQHGPVDSPYAACSSPISKEKWIRFIPRLRYMPRLPYKVRCSVINHGAEALKLGGKDRGNHFKDYTIETEGQHKNFEHWETALYRGLHYLKVEVRSHGARFEGTVGVFVE